MTIFADTDWIGLPPKKRRRAAALQNAPRKFSMVEKREASWSAPVLWRFGWTNESTRPTFSLREYA